MTFEDKQFTNKEHLWAPVNSFGDDYGIYNSTVNRIDYIENLVELVRKLKLDQETAVVRALRSIQDRFQLLSLHMELQHQYKDSELVQVYGRNSVSPWKMYMPSPRHVSLNF